MSTKSTIPYSTTDHRPGSALITIDGIDGLEYLASSPAPEHGGFHPLVVETAKGALEELNRLRTQLAAKENQRLEWQVGTPDVAEGKRESFWCAVPTASGKTSCVTLEYLNRYAMPASDDSDQADDAEPVPGSEEEYYWSGWHQESCDICETSWDYSGKVIAWVRVPVYLDETH